MGPLSYRYTQKTSDNHKSYTVATAEGDRRFAKSQEGLTEVEHDSQLPPLTPGFRGLSPELTGKLTPIQAKLIINPPGDEYEQEADQVAAKVVRQINLPNSDNLMTEVVSQPQEMVDYGAVVRKPITSVKPARNGSATPLGIEASIQQESGKGQALKHRIRQPMEQALGHDLSRVRIHTDARADQMNRALGARAFTTGRDIFFRAGEFNLESRSGQELISHEVIHSLQQKKLQQNRRLEHPTNPVQRMATSSQTSQIVQCTRSQKTISDDEYKKNIEDTNKIEQRTGTSQGVYGGTGAKATAGFQHKTPEDIYKGQLGLEILKQATIIRGMPHETEAQQQARRDEAQKYNLKINYGGEKESQIGRHTLQVGIDIVGSFNAMQKPEGDKQKGVSRMYDYGKIAKRLDEVVEGSRNSSKRGEKKYFHTKVDGEELKNRRKKVVEGLKGIVEGKINKLPDIDGITELGKKWIYKFATIMLAEQSRTMEAMKIVGKDIKTTESVVIKALDNVIQYGFAKVFDQGPKDIMFVGAGKGGAKNIRDYYAAGSGRKRKAGSTEEGISSKHRK